jgi:hypothetical protein
MNLGFFSKKLPLVLGLVLIGSFSSVKLQTWMPITFTNGSFHQLATLADPTCAPAGFLGRSTAMASWKWYGLPSASTTLTCDSFPELMSVITCGARGSSDFNTLGIFDWIGTEGQGVFGRSADTLLHFSPANSPLPDGTIRHICQRNDTLWVATAGGLARVHGNQWKTWTLADGLASSHVTDFEFLPDGSIAFASVNGGLSFLRGDTLSDILDNHNSWLPDNTLTGIEVTTDGHIWLSFTTAGLVRLQQGVPTFFQTQNGALPSNGIRQVAAVQFPTPGILVATETAGMLWLDGSGVIAHWSGGGSFPFSHDEILWVRGATADFPFHMAASLHQVYLLPLGNQSIEEVSQAVMLQGNWRMPEKGTVHMVNALGQVCFTGELQEGATVPRPGPAGLYYIQLQGRIYRQLWLD